LAVTRYVAGASQRPPAPTTRRLRRSSFFDVVSLSSLSVRPRLSPQRLSSNAQEQGTHEELFPASSRIALPSYSQTANLILLCAFCKLLIFSKIFFSALFFLPEEFWSSCKKKTPNEE
jgi:hypothetical protein